MVGLASRSLSFFIMLLLATSVSSPVPLAGVRASLEPGVLGVNGLSARDAVIQSVPVGGSFSISIDVKGMSPFGLYDVRVGYDHSLLDAVSVNFTGSILYQSESAVITFFPNSEEPNEFPGVVRISQGLDSGSVSGSGHLANITFIVLATSRTNSLIDVGLNDDVNRFNDMDSFLDESSVRILHNTFDAFLKPPLPYHGPIRITSDAEFTIDNGVVSGSGTAVDPYIIQGWEIIGAHGAAIRIAGTSADFVIRDVLIYDLEGWEPPTVQQRGIWVTDTSSHFTISNVTIHDVSDGVLFMGVRNGRIEESKIFSTRYAIILISSSRNVISNNDVSGNYRGIDVEAGSSDNIIESNVANYNQANGIVVSDIACIFEGCFTGPSPRNIVRNNEASFNGPSSRCCGGGIGVSSSYGAVVGNIMTDNDFGMGLGGDNILVLNNTVTRSILGISVQDVENVTFKDNRVFDSWFGMEIISVFHHVVTGNEFRNNIYYGISVVASTHHLITDNTVQGSRIGLWLQNSHLSTVSDNNLQNNSRTGIQLVFSSNNVITGNTVEASPEGISVSYARHNAIADNILSDNEVGIRLYATLRNLVWRNVVDGSSRGVVLQDSGYNWVVGNSLTNNEVGIFLCGRSQDNRFRSPPNDFSGTPVPFQYCTPDLSANSQTDSSACFNGESSTPGMVEGLDSSTDDFSGVLDCFLHQPYDSNLLESYYVPVRFTPL